MTSARRGTLLALAGLALAYPMANDGRGAGTVYRSPLALAVSTDGKTLCVSDKTAGCVSVFDAVAMKPLREIALPEEPQRLAISADGKTLFVALRKAHAVAVVDLAQATVTRRIAVGLWPSAVVLAEKHNRLYTSNRGDHTVSIVELSSGKELRRVPVGANRPLRRSRRTDRDCWWPICFPRARAPTRRTAADVSLIETGSMEAKARIKLPLGSTPAMGVAASPDGRWAYVVHAMGKFNLPITQLERGWVHTYAVSILDLGSARVLATLLLDDLTGGAADPWDVVVSPDGKRLWISHSGIHEVSTLEIGKVHDLLEGRVSEDLAGLKDGMRDNVWVRTRADRKQTEKLANDLTALVLAARFGACPAVGSAREVWQSRRTASDCSLPTTLAAP